MQRDTRVTMKILALTNLYPNPLQPHRAAFNRHRFRFLAGLHEIRLIAPIAWRDEWSLRGTGVAIARDRRTVSDGIPVEHPRYWYTPGVLRGWYGRFFLESVRRSFDRHVREFAPDMVFATWAYPDGWAAVQLARRHGLPVVLQVHGSDVRRVDEYAARREGTRAALATADGVIAVSADLGRRVVELGADAERVAVVMDGVDKAVFGPGDRATAREALALDPATRHLLFIGNLVHVKGIDVLLQACRRLADARDDWHLHLIGEGSDRARLAQQAHALGLADRISFHGSRPHNELPRWLHAADLFVLPSRSEGVPNVLLEASACGTPWLASEVGGIPEIAALGASTLVPPEDADALASGIAGCLDRPVPQPAVGPRDRRDAVAAISDFLVRTTSRVRAAQPLSRPAPI